MKCKHTLENCRAGEATLEGKKREESLEVEKQKP